MSKNERIIILERRLANLTRAFLVTMNLLTDVIPAAYAEDVQRETHKFISNDEGMLDE